MELCFGTASTDGLAQRLAMSCDSRAGLGRPA